MCPLRLETSRLVVRDFVESDLDDIFEYARHDDANRFMTFPSPQVPADSLPFLRKAIADAEVEQRMSFEMGIEFDGHIVGGVGVRKQYRPYSAELGYILHKDCWGFGYMTEACSALIDFAFRQLEIHRVWAIHDLDNIASQHVMEKLGMTYEGELREECRNRDGRYVNVALRSILASDDRTQSYGRSVE